MSLWLKKRIEAYCLNHRRHIYSESLISTPVTCFRWQGERIFSVHHPDSFLVLLLLLPGFVKSDYMGDFWIKTSSELIEQLSEHDDQPKSKAKINRTESPSKTQGNRVQRQNIHRFCTQYHNNKQ